jgi:glycosyltransferase involved in cell wall biosynthesis
MRVLHVIPSLASRTGGPAVAVAEIARVTRVAGVDTAVFATDVAHPAIARDARPVAPEELVEGWDGAGTRLFPSRRPRRLVYSPELRDAVRDEVGGYDVVHVHSLYLYPQYAAAREAARRGVPYIVSPHGALDPWLRRRGRLQKAAAELLWQRRMLSGAAALHFTSDEEARLADDVAPGVPRVVVPLGIRWSDYGALPPAEPFRARHLGGSEGPVVLTLGRLTAKKGLDVLIRSFALATRDVPDAILVIAGPDDEGLQPGLTELAEREGVAGRVVFTGMLHGEEKLAALAAADVWALPSHTENFGIAVVEALAAGRPAVISPAVNLAAEIGEAGAALVADPEPGPFSQPLAGLLGDPQRRAQLGTRAREFSRRYDWGALGPRLVEMYRGIA